MKSTGIIGVLVGIVLLHYVSGEDVLDRLNLDEYLKNPKLMEFHIRCLVYNGPCDTLGNEVKRLFSQVGRQCRGCTQQQKIKLGKIIYFWQRNYPQAWQDLMRKPLYNKFSQNQAIESATHKANYKQTQTKTPTSLTSGLNQTTQDGSLQNQTSPK